MQTAIGIGTFELGHGTSRTTGTMEKRQSTRALRQGIQPKRDSRHIAS